MRGDPQAGCTSPDSFNLGLASNPSSVEIKIISMPEMDPQLSGERKGNVQKGDPQKTDLLLLCSLPLPLLAEMDVLPLKIQAPLPSFYIRGGKGKGITCLSGLAFSPFKREITHSVIKPRPDLISSVHVRRGTPFHILPPFHNIIVSDGLIQ